MRPPGGAPIGRRGRVTAARRAVRDVAQLGSALDWGSRGRRFKSCHPDSVFAGQQLRALRARRGSRRFRRESSRQRAVSPLARSREAALELLGARSPGPGDDPRYDDLPTGTARPAGEDLSMSVEQGATRAVRVDAHQHFWDPTTADYPWMSDAPDVVRRPYRPDDLTPILAAAHIDATVVVQARLDMDETRALLRTADEVDAVVGMVGWVDPIGGGSAGRTSSAGCASPRRRGSASTCSSGLVSCRQPLTSRQWSPRSGSSLTTWANPPCATVSTVGGHRRSGVLAPRAT